MNNCSYDYVPFHKFTYKQRSTKKAKNADITAFATILSTSLIVLQPSQSNVVNMQKSDENPKEN